MGNVFHKLRQIHIKMASPAKKRELDSSLQEVCVLPMCCEVVQDKDSVINRLQNVFNTPLYSDIVLRVGEDRFYAHRFILITASSVFEAMLGEERWKEARQPEVYLTEEEECKPVFANFLRYLYCGTVALTTSNVLPFLLLADKYDVHTLRKTCLTYMCHHIVETPDANKTLTWYQYAQATCQNELRDQCLSFILSNFDIIMHASDWNMLTRQEMVSFLSCSEMVVQSETDLWTCVENWLLAENNIKDLEQNLREILPLIRFTMMPPRSLTLVEKSELFEDHQAVFERKLNRAYRRHSLVMDSEDSNSTASLIPQEPYRNYMSGEYCVCYPFCLPNYSAINKIDSRIVMQCLSKPTFASLTRAKSENDVSFSLNFFPRGHFTTLTLYGSYMNRQNDEITLKVSCNKPLQKPMKVDVTLLLLGNKNGVKYAAFTHNCSMIFTKENKSLSAQKMLSLESLMKEDSPYLVEKDLEGKIFLKIQDIGDHLLTDNQLGEV